MIYLHTTTKIYAFIIALCAGVLLMPFAFAHAANLDVVFEADPLFSEASFLPGNEVTRTVEVANNSESTQSVVVEAINASDENGLGDELNLVITEGATTLYEDTLSTFLREGEISLSSLSSNDSTTYSFGVTFVSGAGNGIQETTLGFDLCVGFEGGDTNCGGTVVGGEGDTDGDPPSGGGGSSPGTGGGGGGGGIVPITMLEVDDEEVAEIDTEIGTALIEWNTNLLSTSQVIYGLESGGPYSINLTVEPYFGYPLGTVPDPLKVTSHSVLLTGLIPGETYKYRVVSRASPPTVGFEFIFDFTEGGSVVSVPSPILALVDDGESGGSNTDNEIPDIPQQQSTESVGEIPAEETVGGQEEVLDTETEEEAAETDVDIASDTAAAALLAFPDDFTGWFACINPFVIVLILIIISLLWMVWKKKHKNDQSFNENISQKRSLFFLTGLILSIIGAYFFGYSCDILPLLLIAIFFTGLLIKSRFENKEKKNILS